MDPESCPLCNDIRPVYHALTQNHICCDWSKEVKNSHVIALIPGAIHPSIGRVLLINRQGDHSPHLVTPHFPFSEGSLKGVSSVQRGWG